MIDTSKYFVLKYHPKIYEGINGKHVFDRRCDEIEEYMSRIIKKVDKITGAIRVALVVHLLETPIIVNQNKNSPNLIEELAGDIIALDVDEFTKWDIKCRVTDVCEGFIILKLNTITHTDNGDSVVWVIMGEKEYRITHYKLPHSHLRKIDNKSRLNKSVCRYYNKLREVE
jgi:hypothetical protein